MSDNALESQGTRLFIHRTTGSPSIIPVTDVRDINFRTGSATVNDVTDLDSTHREKRMGLPDEGQCTFTLMYRPKEASHEALLAARTARAKTTFELEMTDDPTPTRYRFSAYVLSLPVSAATDGVVESAVVLEITGPVVEL